MTARSPLFTARIDRARATVSARGRLDSAGADLLRGTVESLQREGSGAITVDLAQLAAGDDDVLTGIVSELAATGARIVVRRRPTWSAPTPA